MFNYNYKLDVENYIDLNYYLAIHDSKIQKKVVPLMVSIATLLIIAVALVTGVSMILLYASIIIFLIVAFVFPKLYWKIIFKRIKNTIDQKKVSFRETEIYFNEDISIKTADGEINVEYKDLIKIDFTKANCLLFYVNQNKTNSIIIPNSTIGNQLEEFYQFIMKEIAKNEQK